MSRGSVPAKKSEKNEDVRLKKATTFKIQGVKKSDFFTPIHFIYIRNKV